MQQDKEQYLRDFYTNSDKKMVCQICREEMPFRRRADNEYYFEAVEFLKSTKREYHENYLALCPTCAAKFHHANGSSVNELRQVLFTSQTIQTLEIAITLTDKQQAIKFVQVHLDDLKTVIEHDSF